jgi:hypothetical protein
MPLEAQATLSLDLLPSASTFFRAALRYGESLTGPGTGWSTHAKRCAMFGRYTGRSAGGVKALSGQRRCKQLQRIAKTASLEAGHRKSSDSQSIAARCHCLPQTPCNLGRRASPQCQHRQRIAGRSQHRPTSPLFRKKHRDKETLTAEQPRRHIGKLTCAL